MGVLESLDVTMDPMETSPTQPAIYDIQKEQEPYAAERVHTSGETRKGRMTISMMGSLFYAI
jgi:hypothetical protein